MKEANILDIERRHLNEENGHRKIYLFKQGKFLRAYSYSAFLLDRHSPSEIKITKAHSSTGDKIYCGFPEESIEKFTGIEGAKRSFQNSGTPEETVTVILPDSVPDLIETVQDLLSEYDEWMQSIPVSQKKQSKQESSPSDILSIVKEIVRYPLEQKSLIENTDFLINVRQRLIKLI